MNLTVPLYPWPCKKRVYYFELGERCVGPLQKLLNGLLDEKYPEYKHTVHHVTSNEDFSQLEVEQKNIETGEIKFIRTYLYDEK